MFLIRKSWRYFALITILAMSLLFISLSAQLTQAQAIEKIELVYEKFRYQTVTVSDLSGINLGSGEFRLSAVSSREQTNGRARLQLGESIIDTEITGSEIIYDQDVPVGVVLSGRISGKDGLSLAHEVTHIIQFGTGGACCQVEILGEGIHESGGVRFLVDGTLEIR